MDFSLGQLAWTAIHIQNSWFNADRSLSNWNESNSRESHFVYSSQYFCNFIITYVFSVEGFVTTPHVSLSYLLLGIIT